MSHFSEVVKEHFSFLREAGFQLVGETDRVLRYESDTLMLEISYDSLRSYEIDLQLGLLASAASRTFNLGEILRAVGAPEADELSLVQASEPRAVERCVAKIAEAVMKRAGGVLRGEADLLNALAEQREKEGRAYRRANELRRAREEARAAWQEGDYSTYAAIMAPFREDLTGVEEQKLAYCEKRAG